MYFFPFFLVFLAACAAYFGMKEHHSQFKKLAVILLIAAFGSGFVAFIATTLLNPAYAR